MKEKKMKKLTLVFLFIVTTMLWVTSCNEGDNDAKTFSITWIDENGTTLSSTNVEEGKVPSYDYRVTDTAEWDYTFEGWATSAGGEVLASVPSATADATYYARVLAIKQKYTVTFDSNGGSAVAPQTVEYGNTAVAPTAPDYEGYHFVGWSATQNDRTAVDFTAPITGDTTYYAIWNKILNMKSLLETLLNGYKLDPMGYLPESMRFDYSSNLVDADDIIQDYSTFVNTSDITYGFGEQWHMVLENLQQSETFFNVLSVVDTLSATSVTAFTNYLDGNPSDTAHYTLTNGIYHVTIDFDGETISYVLDYTATLPILGEQTVQIALSMSAETGERFGRIQLGDANALTYKIFENSYEFAVKYLGARRAFFTIKRADDGSVDGHIFEYLTVSSVEIASAAEFYITEDYVSVVGNKASGMAGFTGYICELYNTETGKMLGYEVNETLSSIVYNTLWFNLNDISGIHTIKYIPRNGDVPAQLYVNGSTAIWETKKVGGLNIKALSRRFDIEFRTQYVYSYDATNEKFIEHKIEVPMIFVQEENYDTFVNDVKSVNNVNIGVSLTNTELSKLLLDYDVLIPVFIVNKNNITPEIILTYIGNKINFNEET